MLVAALLGALLAAPSPETFPKGQVVEKVVVARAPGQSYALYLPSTYTSDRFWPVLYMLDARGNALVPLERFREAAERFGWILVSSYNSRSDTKDPGFTGACESGKPAPAPTTPAIRPGSAYARATAARPPPEKPVAYTRRPSIANRVTASFHMAMKAGELGSSFVSLREL